MYDPAPTFRGTMIGAMWTKVVLGKLAQVMDNTSPVFTPTDGDKEWFINQ